MFFDVSSAICDLSLGVSQSVWHLCSKRVTASLITPTWPAATFLSILQLCHTGRLRVSETHREALTIDVVLAVTFSSAVVSAEIWKWWAKLLVTFSFSLKFLKNFYLASLINSANDKLLCGWHSRLPVTWPTTTDLCAIQITAPGPFAHMPWTFLPFAFLYAHGLLIIPTATGFSLCLWNVSLCVSWLRPNTLESLCFFSHSYRIH